LLIFAHVSERDFRLGVVGDEAERIVSALGSRPLSDDENLPEEGVLLQIFDEMGGDTGLRNDVLGWDELGHRVGNIVLSGASAAPDLLVDRNTELPARLGKQGELGVPLLTDEAEVAEVPIRGIQELRLCAKAERDFLLGRLLCLLLRIRLGSGATRRLLGRELLESLKELVKVPFGKLEPTAKVITHFQPIGQGQGPEFGNEVHNLPVARLIWDLGQSGKFGAKVEIVCLLTRSLMGCFIAYLSPKTVQCSEFLSAQESGESGVPQYRLTLCEAVIAISDGPDPVSQLRVTSVVGKTLDK
jgi:hypothetical protein